MVVIKMTVLGIDIAINLIIAAVCTLHLYHGMFYSLL